MDLIVRVGSSPTPGTILNNIHFMSFNYLLNFAVILMFTFVGCNSSLKNDDKTLLIDYVNSHDPSFRYDMVDTIIGDGWKEYKIRMVSGSWLDKNDFDDNSNEWWHWISVIVPDNLEKSTSMMVIGSGSTQDFSLERYGNKKTNSQYLKAALKTKSIISEINNVPFQPINFSGDNKLGRYEDDLIAYSWRQFLEGSAKDSEWLPRFPMTRAVVRAMDVVQEISNEINNPVDSFFVTGASKRGWVAWTTAIADDRVMGIAPVVIDLLNLYPSFQHHWKVYGEWSPAIDDYVKEDIMNWTESKEYEKLIEITDPYSYRFSLNMPKYIINASSDEFFVTDSWQFYWDDLVGEKHLQYLPNAGHGLYGTYVTDENCERIKLSKTLSDLGMKVAAVSILCQDERVFYAMEQSGTPCPFEGKIGKAASEQWKKYDKLRPDFVQYTDRLNIVKNMKETEKKEKELAIWKSKLKSKKDVSEEDKKEVDKLQEQIKALETEIEFDKKKVQKQTLNQK